MQGIKIKNAMKEAGLTQENLARKIGVKQSEISRWVIGKRVPKLSTLKKIASATGVSLNYFLDSSKNSSDISGNNNIVANESKNVTQIISTGVNLEKEFETINLKLDLLLERLKK